MAGRQPLARLLDARLVAGVVEAAVGGVEHDAGRLAALLGKRLANESAARCDSTPGTRMLLS